MKARHISYWLIPTASDAEILEEIIDLLAIRFHAPRFPPHLTLFAGPTSPQDNPRKLLNDLSLALVPKKLSLIGADATRLYTMSFFLRCRPEAQLLQLHEHIRQNSSPSQYRIDPHISLLYADLPIATKMKLIEKHPVALHHIHFDRIRAVDHPSPVQSKEDVEDFQDICEVEIPQH